MPERLPPSPIESVPEAELPAVTTCPGGTGSEKESPKTFDELVAEINDLLETCSGQSFNEIEKDKLVQAMKEYNTNETEWEKYACENREICYTRNMVHRCNDKANILVLVWNPGKCSPIHDHAGAHCIMKMLKGSLTEEQFKTPVEGDEGKPMTKTGQRVVNLNEVAYIADTIGLHRIWNKNTNEVAVSLHLYTPPWAETKGCHTYNLTNSKANHEPTCKFYSFYGIVGSTEPSPEQS